MVNFDNCSLKTQFKHTHTHIYLSGHFKINIHMTNLGDALIARIRFQHVTQLAGNKQQISRVNTAPSPANVVTSNYR